MKGISVLVPAHNEEKIIGMALDNLARLKKIYPNIEVICGNDGSADRTEEIILKYPFVKYVKNKERQGKHAMMDKMLEIATNDIILIHDADRVFSCEKGELERLLKCFDDSKVGGLGDYYTTTFDENKVKTAKSMLYLGDAWSTLFMLEWKMKNFAKRIDNKLYTDDSKGMMFYINFYRKGAVEQALTMCDDGERYIQMLRKGYKVRLLETEQRPNLKASYSDMDAEGFIKTKVRGIIAQNQIDEKYGGFTINPSASLFWYILKNMYRVKRPRAFFGVIYWWYLVAVARMRYKKIRNKKMSSKEGWDLRMKGLKSS